MLRRQLLHDGATRRWLVPWLSMAYRFAMTLLFCVTASGAQYSTEGRLIVEVWVQPRTGPPERRASSVTYVSVDDQVSGTVELINEPVTLLLRNGMYQLTAAARAATGAWIQSPSPSEVYVPAMNHARAPLLLNPSGVRNSRSSQGDLRNRSVPRLVLVLYAQDPPAPRGNGNALCLETTGTVNILRGGVLRPLVAASVSITPDGGNTPVFERVTDQNGEYVVPQQRLNPDAAYHVTVRKSGYYTSTLPASCTTIPPHILMSQQINQGLSLIELGDPARRDLFLPSLLEALPLDRIRSFDSFTLLAPGVLPAPAAADAHGPGIGPGIGAPGQYSINGARSRENNFEFDGSDNNDEEFGVRRQGFVSPAPEAVESIAEFQIITAFADARYGRNIGGQIDALTRRGGIEYHGTGYGFLSNQRLNARNFFNAPPSGAPAPGILLDNSPFVPGPPPSDADPFTRSQAGFNLSGPLVHRKTGAEKNLFMFLAFERQAVRSSVSSHFNVPTLDQRGIFNTGRTGTLGAANFMFFPSSLPGDAIFSLFPLPNNPSGPYGANTYTTRLSSDGNGYLGSLNLDYRIPRLRSFFTGRYNRTTEDSELPSVEGALDSSLIPRFRTHNVATYFTTDATPNLANAFSFSFGQTRARFDRSLPAGFLTSPNYGADPYLLNAPLWLNLTQDPQHQNALPKYVTAASQAGRAQIALLGPYSIPSNTTTTEPITGALGQVNIAGFSPVGVDPYRFPQQRADYTLQFADMGTWIHGRHTFYVGFDLRRVVLDSTVERNTRPLAEFHGLPVIANPSFGSQAPPAPFFSSSTMAAAGVPSGLFQTLANTADDSLSLHRTQTDFFVQYTGRLSPRLAISAGARVEFYSLPEDSSGRLAQAFDINQLTSAAQQVGKNSACGEDCQSVLVSLQNAFPAGFAQTFGANRAGINPRLGFAWDPLGDGRTSVRGGAGMYTAQFPGIIIDESRSVFPSFMSFNFSSPFGINAPLFLLNPANPSDPQIGSGIIVPGTLNRIPPSLVGATPTQAQSAVELVALRLAQGGFGNATFQVPSLQFTQPGGDLQNARSLQFGLTVEREIGLDNAISLAYVGTLGRHLLQVATPDLGPSQSKFLFTALARVTSSFPIFNGFLLPPQSDAKGDALLFPISRQIWEGTGNSGFHSLQAEWKRRYRSGLLYGIALTYSHSIDDGSDFFNSPQSPALPQDSLHPSERGSSSFDSRVRVVSHFVWDLPVGSRHHWWGGWQLAGIHTAQSGQPFTVTSSIDVNGDGNLTDRLNSTIGLIQGPVAGDRRIRLALASGVDPLTLLSRPLQNGRVGRNTFRAGGLLHLDAALLKTFAISDRSSLQFRAEAFNVFNRPEFGIPVGVLESSGFGSSVGTLTPARTLQGALKLRF